jgi:hypothetical protein
MTAWTTCPYIRKDGQTNPDVKDLPKTALYNTADGSLLNSIAYILTNASEHATSATSLLKHFFLDPENAINPNVKYGQVVRGPPGRQEGSYTGILDFRSMVKVVNSILVLKNAQSAAWTEELESGMKEWATKYLSWLESSEQGHKAAESKK